MTHLYVISLGDMEPSARREIVARFARNNFLQSYTRQKHSMGSRHAVSECDDAFAPDIAACEAGVFLVSRQGTETCCALPGNGDFAGELLVSLCLEPELAALLLSTSVPSEVSALYKLLEATRALRSMRRRVDCGEAVLFVVTGEHRADLVEAMAGPSVGEIRHALLPEDVLSALGRRLGASLLPASLCPQPA